MEELFDGQGERQETQRRNGKKKGNTRNVPLAVHVGLPLLRMHLPSQCNRVGGKQLDLLNKEPGDKLEPIPIRAASIAGVDGEGLVVAGGVGDARRTDGGCLGEFEALVHPVAGYNEGRDVAVSINLHSGIQIAITKDADIQDVSGTDQVATPTRRIINRGRRHISWSLSWILRQHRKHSAKNENQTQNDERFFVHFQNLRADKHSLSMSSDVRECLINGQNSPDQQGYLLLRLGTVPGSANLVNNQLQ